MIRMMTEAEAAIWSSRAAVLRRVAADIDWMVKECTKPLLRESSIAAKIMSYMSRMTNSRVSTRHLHEACGPGAKRASVSATCARLAKLGHIERESHGYYRLPSMMGSEQ